MQGFSLSESKRQLILIFYFLNWTRACNHYVSDVCPEAAAPFVQEVPNISIPCTPCDYPDDNTDKDTIITTLSQLAEREQGGLGTAARVGFGDSAPWGLFH